ncbi:MAG TPA: hypothetical protein VI911_06995 [Patescibacteria group bacterium]|nr:hypothetical protein [Patescibacteria group bacterium]
MKKLHSFELVLSHADKSGKNVDYYKTLDSFAVVTHHRGSLTVTLKTSKGEYKLDKHTTMNYFYGTCIGTRVQVSLATRKKAGELRAWY